MPMPVSTSGAQSSVPRPPFRTSPKLQAPEKVMRDFPGTDVASLKRLAVRLAKYAIFGRYELSTKSLSGRKNTTMLEAEKLEYNNKDTYQVQSARKISNSSGKNVAPYFSNPAKLYVAEANVYQSVKMCTISQFKKCHNESFKK